MASPSSDASPMANAPPASPPPPATPTPVVVGFQTKKMVDVQGAMPPASSTAATVTPERMAYLVATLAKLPELDLGETARVKTCFAAALGEGRENIVNSLELRVVLSDLGLYPSEEELKLVLRAYRDRVNLVGLTRYLRLYKKEFWLNQVAARSTTGQAQQATPGVAGSPDTGAIASTATNNSSKKSQLAGASSGPTNDASSTTGSAGGVRHTYAVFSNNHAPPDVAAGRHDEDTLRAFVALGGGEDGSGEISAATLRDAVRGFGLTIDIDAMIRTVDVHHSGMLDYVDFCALWAAQADTTSSDSIGSALRQASADAERHGSINENSSPTPISTTSRRLMSVLMTPSRRCSLAAGMLQRHSYLLTSGYENGTSQPITPRLAAAAAAAGAGSVVGGMSGNNTRPPTSCEQPDGGADSMGHRGIGASAMRAPVTAAAAPAPITEEEHALLVRMFFFPEQFEAVMSSAASNTSEGVGRRGGTRFTLPSRGAQAASPSCAANAANGGAGEGAGGANTASVSQRLASQRKLSQSNLSGSYTNSGARPWSQTRRGGSKKRSLKAGTKRRGGGGNNKNDGSEVDASDDLAADFFSPKNQNVYRPPSPMLLSMRNSTAYRNRVKRLEEQKHVSRGEDTYQARQGRLYAATAARDYGADGESPSRPAKSSTW